MRRLALAIASILLVMVATLAMTSQGSPQEPKQGAYFSKNSCNFFNFTRGNSEEIARAKKACEDCTGAECEYVEKVYQYPACLDAPCKNEGSNSELTTNNSTETTQPESSGVSLENDAACPAPDCHYESDGRGGRVCRCEVKLERKRYNQANGKSTVQNKKQNAAALTDECISLGQSQNFDATIGKCTEAIKARPRDGSAYAQRGFAYQSKQEHNKAIADFTKAIELDPSTISGYSARANSYAALGNLDRAIADVTTAIELDEQDGPYITWFFLYRSRADYYERKGLFEYARRDRAKAAELERKANP